MKQLLLLFFFSIFSLSLFSQACMPDSIYADSMVGVYPPPMNATNPDGGINTTACLNKEYEFIFTFVIPDTVPLQGNNYLLDSVVVVPDGVLNLPAGMTYDCNPSSCVFTPADSLGCLVIKGTVTDPMYIGDHNLEIMTEIHSSFIISPFPITFPNIIFPGADGTYTLTVVEENTPDCFVVGTEDYLTENVFISNRPNPFGEMTTFEVHSKVNEVLNFQVFDMLGKVVHQDQIEIFEGANTFDFDGSRLSNGIYNYSLNNDQASLSGKMVISR